MNAGSDIGRDQLSEAAIFEAIGGFIDADWYGARNPDVIAAGADPVVHFVRHGIAEQRDPNPFFSSAWYLEHYPDVGASGLHPLLHYLKFGSAELRNPHPGFDAVYYVNEHPEAAANPLLYHIRVGHARGYLTEKPVRIEDHLPSSLPALRPPAKLCVDIVVPAYRGLAETARCLESVLADPARPPGRIIVVDDCSPEPDLTAWLSGLAAQGRIVLAHNPRNLGFVASVNRGMALAGAHDVVLLNSDTEVPPGWLGRLAAHAYAAPRVATVSPLSNNATICGYPDNDGGPVAFGLAMSEIDEVCRTVNAGRWVDAPTTVGFCMYIRRAALQQVGPFDAERFTLGYGEENDFCLRASALGWRHRIACDTFVFHAGSVSFGDRAAKLAARAMTLLQERYPDYPRIIANHVGLDMIGPFRFAITAALFARSTQPVILMVAHDLGGGVRRHIDRLTDRLRGQARFLLLQATDRGATLSVPALPGHPVLDLSAERLDDLLELLHTMNVSRVHIHHLLGMGMDIRSLVHRLDVPFDVTVHDYYAICPQINLLPWRYSLYCGEPDIAGCNSCIANRSSHGARDIVTWRGERAWQFRQADRVLCPSRDVLQRLSRYGLADNAVLAPHEALDAGTWPLRAVSPGQGKLRIAVLGTLVDHKGARTVASVAELADRKTTEIHLIGHIDGAFPEQALKRMKITGRYDDADLPDLIETIAPHVIWFPAVWPETFSYTLSAAIRAGVSIAATQIGAHTERLHGRPFTWLAGIDTTPTGWLCLFAAIRAHLTDDRRAKDAAPRAAVADFYATQYLRPVGKGRRVQRRNKPAPPRIAIIPERFAAGFPTPCAYIRLLQPLDHPAAAAGFQVSVSDVGRVLEEPADIIVTQRYAIPDQEAADRLARHARRSGATLVYDLDDDLLNISPAHEEAAVLRPRAAVVRRMLELADDVWVSTPALAQSLGTLRASVQVMENRLDERLWLAPPTPTADQPVRILCMGTATHGDDFNLIVPALTRLKAEYGRRVNIDVIGMTNQPELPAGLNRVAMPRSATRSYPAFVNWLTSVQPAWHIGLAPLLDTAFNLSKSPIKTMDYAALGLAVLASDVPAYRGSLADGVAGQLVLNNPAAWYGALNRLVRDHDRRQALADRARGAFLDRASLGSHATVRHAAWTRLLKIRRSHAA